jgi:hypothetical protein
MRARMAVPSALSPLLLAAAVVIGLSLLPAAAAVVQTDDFPTLTGPYLGQKPPGRSPEVLAPGIVAFGHASVTISNNGTEIYWADDRIYLTRYENDRWTRPEPPPFSPEDAHDDGPKLSPDNRKL